MRAEEGVLSSDPPGFDGVIQANHEFTIDANGVWWKPRATLRAYGGHVKRKKYAS
jgi:hypothetical protein